MGGGTEQAKAFEERTGLGAFAPTHVSHKQVEAYPLDHLEKREDGRIIAFVDVGGRLRDVEVPANITARGEPRPGSMLVRYAPNENEPDGYLAFSPRAAFEAGYDRILAETLLTSGLPALSLAEAQAVVATKTAPRITEDLMREQISTVEYAKLRHLTICVITLKNGFFSDGMSAPADPSNYDAAVGERYAFDNAFRKLWPMFGFLLRDRLSGGNTLAAVPNLNDAIRVEGADAIQAIPPAA